MTASRLALHQLALLSLTQRRLSLHMCIYHVWPCLKLSLFTPGLWMLGSLPQTAAVPVDKRLAQRLHINGNALYHIGSTAFAAFLELVRTNTASPAPWQVRLGNGN